ncbi:MAG: YfhO family protein [Cyclobacteriaceae bacterium]|nr:YfhO family protein [Cyclobacteriaceae bacterium]
MNFKDDVLPHLFAIIVFLMVSTIFYSPLVFSGKSLDQHDISQGIAASQEIIEHRNQTGEEALWTNSIFGGMPAYLINTRWSGDLMLHVQHLISLWLPSAAGVMLVCCLTFYILLLVFKVRPWLSIIGALGFSLGSFNIISVEAGHMWKMWAIAYMPLVLAGVHLAFNKRLLMGFALVALGLALELRSNHLQMTYYLLILLLIYGAVQLFYALKYGQLSGLLKPLGYLVVAALLAVLCNSGKIWSVYEYGKYSTRGAPELTQEAATSKGLDREYAFRWSNGIMEPLTLMIPEFFGGPSINTLPSDSNLGEALRANGQAPVQVRQYLQQVATYWGDQPFVAGPAYAGAIVMFLFIMGLSLVDRRNRLWLVIAILLSILLSWGNNFEIFNNLMFDYFPGYNKFRSVSFTIVIALVCIPLVGFLGLEKLMANASDPKVRTQLVRAGIITGSILVLAVIYSNIGSFRGANDEQLFSQVPPWYAQALKADRASILRNDAIRSLIFAGLVWLILFYHVKNKVARNLVYAILGVMVLADLWGVNKRYLQNEDFISRNTLKPAATAADQQILQDPDLNYRVLSFLSSPWNDAVATSYHRSVGGYHGAKMRRYADVIEGCLDTEFRSLLQELRSNGQVGSHPVLNMLNTKYLIAGNEAGSAIRNPYAQGSAWFVPEVQLVNSADEEFAALCNLPIASKALVDQSKFPIDHVANTNTFSTSGSVVLEDYKPNYLKYRTQNQELGFAVFSEIYYPKGWQATIDGASTEIIRANYLLRALVVPAGSHVIEFKFVPKAYIVGNRIMMVSSTVLMIIVLLIFYREIKKSIQTRNLGTASSG